MRDENKSLRVALHESSHGLACHALGGTLDHAAINDNGITGQVEWIGATLPSVLHQAVVSLAGPAADAILVPLVRDHRPQWQPGNPRVGDDADVARHVERLALITGIAKEQVDDVASEIAVRFVMANADAIESIAHALVRRRRIPGDDFAAMAEACGVRKGHPRLYGGMVCPMPSQ